MAAVFAFLAYLIVERPGVGALMSAAKARALPAVIAVFTGAIGIWAVYSFSFGKVNAWNINLPAPELFDGVSFAIYHNTKGHAAYFMGEIRNTGWWYFFPVLLAVKTPLAWLVAVGFGLGAWWGRRARLAYWMPVAFAAGILLPSMTSHVNIGLRHILPIFTAPRDSGGSRTTAASGARLARKMGGAAGRGAGAMGDGLGHRAAPDYLSYFNELAGSNPERIVVDSDLDWGQNTIRLQRRLKELGAAQVSFGDLNLRPNHLMMWPGLPNVQNLDAFRPVEGWTAVSPTMWMLRYGPISHRFGRPAMVGLLPPGRESGHTVALLPAARNGKTDDARQPLAVPAPYNYYQ